MPLGVQMSPLPHGGLHLWTALPEHHDDLDIAQRARQHQIIVGPGSPYYAAEPPGPHLRLSYAALPEDQAEPAVRTLAQVLATS